MTSRAECSNRGNKMKTPPFSGVLVRHQAGHSVRDFSRVSQIQLWAAVLFQGTVGPFTRDLDLIAGGVSSMRNLLRRLLPCGRDSRGLTGSAGETGPFQQTLAMAILKGFQATHGTR